MARKDKWSSKVSGIRTSLEELEILSSLVESQYWPVITRLRGRLFTLWKDQSFKLDETDPQFSMKHQRYVERALGIDMFLKFIESSAKKLAAEEDE